MNKFLQKISDITHLHKRAAFSDIPKPFSDKESVFRTLARERYSCRSFQGTPVPEPYIRHIIEAARLAPTAANKQPVHVWVASTPEAVDKLKDATDYIYGAPVVFIVGAKPDAAWVRKYDGKNGAETDAAIVGTHIMLEASALGLGNVWVGSFDPAKVLAAFPEMAGYEIMSLFPVGFPAAGPGANHDKRVPEADFVTTL